MHIFGAVLGAGGAYVSDAMFLSSVKDKRINSTELRFLRIGSGFVWLGLSILLLSGVGIFISDPVLYLESDKFLAKMSVVLIITLNGIVFHLWHIPLIRSHVNKSLGESKTFRRRRPYLVASGALSFVSWTLALILGTWSNIPFTYSEIMLGYIAVVCSAILVALLIVHKTKAI